MTPNEWINEIEAHTGRSHEYFNPKTMTYDKNKSLQKLNEFKIAQLIFKNIQSFIMLENYPVILTKNYEIDKNTVKSIEALKTSAV